MKRREFIGVLAGIAFGTPLVTTAQQLSKRVIGILGLGSAASFSENLAAFRRGMDEAGYLDGTNLTVEYRWANGRYDLLPALAAELANLKVEVIATFGGTAAASAAKDATSSIPIIFETGADPVAMGLVASFASPGGNLTGISILTGELNEKRFGLLTELVPKAQVIALLVNPNHPIASGIITDVRQAARVKKIQLQVIEAETTRDFEKAFLSVIEVGAEALQVANDPYFFSRREQLVGLATQHKVPAIYEWREFAALGGLMSYGANITNMYRQVGTYVGRVLNGERPANMPVLRADKFELVVNLTTAKILGLTIPPTLLARADEVIE